MSKFYYLLATVVVMIFCFNGVNGWGQTPYVMSTGDYFQDFTNISSVAIWGNNFGGTGTEDDHYKSVTAIPGKLMQSTVFQQNYSSGGIYRGGIGNAPNSIPAGMIGMGVTGPTDGGNVAAFDLYIDFSNRVVGNISLDYSKAQNVASATPRSASFKIQYSVDNGLTFTDIPGSLVVILNNTSSETGTINLPLPDEMNNESDIVFRFYLENIDSTGSGNRPRIALDNLLITSYLLTSSYLSASSLQGFGNVCINTTEGPNSFFLSGTNLDGSDVVIGPLIGYTFSASSGGTFTSSLVLSAYSGNSTSVFVKFSPNAIQSYTGNIPASGGGVALYNIPVAGTGIYTQPFVSSGTATDITASGATLGGIISASGCSPVLSYGIEYSSISGFADGSGIQVAAANLAGDEFSSVITGLSSNTIYYYKAYATNNAGTKYGLQQSFTTTNIDAPVSNAALNITHDSFIANWSTISGADDYRLDVSVSPTFGTVIYATDLIISEYVEGSYNNKYIEIFNGTGDTIDLSDYRLQFYPNGAASPNKDVILSGYLSNFCTIVYRHIGATIYNGSTTINAAVNFNGNDAVVLFKISTNSPVDIIGRIGEDPGIAWTSGSHTTLAKTLVRKATVTGGVTTNPASGFPTLSTEWDVYDYDNVLHLGSHTFNNIMFSYIQGYENLTVNGTSQGVTGLSANTTYYYRVRANSSIGTSANSNVISVRTYNDLAIADFRSKTSGNYSDPATWEYNYTGSNYQDAAVPPTTSNITIQGGHIVHFDTAFTLANGKALVIEPNAEIRVHSGATVDLNGQPVTIRSTASGTGRIGRVQGILLNATNVTVEQYIPAKRSWRLLTAPVTNTTIYKAWQENGSNPQGYGTLVTGYGTGYDPGNYSIKTYTPSIWITSQLTATDAGDISDYQGYMLFVRGDRNIPAVAGSQPNNTILRATGTLRQGNLPNYLTVSATGFTLMGNPYPSPIDFEWLYTYYSLQNFYAWDPQQAGSNGTGRYNYIERNGGAYRTTPYSQSSALSPGARYIPAGAAFLLQGIGSVFSIEMQESAKVSNSSSLCYFKVNNLDQCLAVNLATHSSEVIDGIRVGFASNYSNAITAEDAIKLYNNNANIAIRRNSESFIVEKRETITQDDTVFVRITGLIPNNYQLKFYPDAFNGQFAYLEDLYLDTSNLINLSNETSITFSVDTNFASQGDRFRIIFRPGSPLPVTLTSIKAYQSSGSSVKVEWTVSNEQRMKYYQLERSADGHDFNITATVPSSVNVSSIKRYSWVDANPFTGANYYRVRSTSINGDVKYTGIVRVNIGSGEPGLNVYPVPVTGNLVFVQLSNLQKGNYTLKIYSATGQIVMNKLVVHGGGSATGQLLLSGAAKGIYKLELKGNDKRYTSTIILQ